METDPIIYAFANSTARIERRQAVQPGLILSSRVATITAHL